MDMKQQRAVPMDKELLGQNEQVNTYFEENANKILMSPKINLTDIELARKLGDCAGTIVHKLHYYFSKANKGRVRLTRDDLWQMIGKLRSIRTISRALTKLHNLGIIIRETFTKRRKDGRIKSESYYSFNFNKFNELHDHHRETKWPCKYTTSLSSLREEKRSVDLLINTLGVADLSVGAEISPAKNPVVPDRSNVVEFTLTKRMRQKALDAQVPADMVDELFERCINHHEKKGTVIDPKQFVRKIWSWWVLKSGEWKQKSRKKIETEVPMAKKNSIKTKQINLTIDPSIKQEDEVRIRAHLAQLSIPQTTFMVEKVTDDDITEHERSTLWYKVYVAASNRSNLTDGDKKLLYHAHLKAIPVRDDDVRLEKAA